MFRGRDNWATGPVTHVAQAAGVPAASAAGRATGRRISTQGKAWIEAHCHRIDLAPDLAQDIGSARWLRGFATMLGLSFAALSLLARFQRGRGRDHAAGRSGDAR